MNNKTIYICTILFITLPVFAQWQQTSGPQGGYVRSIIYDGSNVLAATGGGVLFSDDGGNSWVFRNNGLTSCDTKSLAQLGEYVYVSTDENVFRTSDAGLTWESAGEELQGFYIKNLVVANDMIFAATYLRGIYRSTDYGNSWTAVNTGISAKYVYYFATDGTNIFAGTYLDGMFRSTDFGDTWLSVNNGLTELNIMSIICFEGKVYASTLSSGVFVSEDNGDTWNSLSTNLPSVKGFTSQSGVLYAASFGGGVYRSLDSGQTWETINNGLSENNIWSIGTSNEAIYVGVTSGRIYRRDLEVGTWELSSDTEFFAGVGSIASCGANLLAGTHGSGFHLSDDEGASWNRVTSIWTVETRAIITHGSLVFAGTDMLGIFKSNNYGQSFSMINTGLTSAWIQAFAICDGNLFAGSGEEGVFVTANGGANWNSVNNGLGSLNILSLVSDNENIYAGTFDSGIYVTDDLGESWSAINNGLNDNCITTIQTESGYIFAGTKTDGVYSSTDQGANWFHISDGLPENTNIRCMHVFEDKLFIGTGSGNVYVSFNNGNYWTELDEGLIGSPVLSVYVYDEFLYAGLNAGGVWKYPISELVETNEHFINEVSNVMLQNYPNPFNPSTTISFSLTTEITENTELVIYNLKGQKVKDLSPSLCYTEPVEVRGKTKYSIIWDGCDDNGKSVSSGIYFYKLIVSSHGQIRKMILIK